MTQNPFSPDADLRNTQREFRIQRNIWEKHQIYFPHVLFHHSPNENKDVKGNVFAAMKGTRKGMSDVALWWAYPKGIKSGMVELKTPGKNAETSQNKWLSAFRQIGGHTGVAHSWKEYYKLLCSFGIKPKEECRIFDEADLRSDTQKKYDAFEIFQP